MLIVRDSWQPCTPGPELWILDLAPLASDLEPLASNLRHRAFGLVSWAAELDLLWPMLEHCHLQEH